MTLDRFGPNDPREWLNRARSNLVHARLRAPEVYLEDLCFECQQAAEKALKGLLLWGGLEFPHTHDLARLIGLLEEAQLRVPDQVKDSVVLTQYASVTRYPGESEPVTETEYDEAVEHAVYVVAWVESIIVDGVDP
jgi:HEPN domain-containing protein